MKTQKNIFENYIVVLIDLLCVVLSFGIALILRFGNLASVAHPKASAIVAVWIVLFTLIYDAVVRDGGGKSFLHRGYMVEAQHCAGFCVSLSVFIALGIFLFRLGRGFSRLVYGYTIILIMISMSCFRILLKWLLRKSKLHTASGIKTILVVPDAAEPGNTLGELSERFNRQRVKPSESDGKVSEIIPIKVTSQGMQDFIETIRTKAVDRVILDLPGASGDYLQKFVLELSNMGIICKVIISIPGLDTRGALPGSYMGQMALSYGEATQKEASRLVIKRIMDIAGGLVGVFITMIMFPFIALAIKLDSPGPVLFSQVRIGRNGRRFRIYKFRSMYIDAEERKKELEAKNEMKGLMFKIEDDPRITKVGNFLRKTSLDEFPQFINVLKGEMSLVGTRPPTEDEFLQYTPYYRRRICMTPGLTGLWQVNGRSSVRDFDDVVRYDLDYIDNWFISMDIKILFKTVAVVFTGRGAG